MRAEPVNAYRHILRGRSELARVEIAQEDHEGLPADPTTGDQLVHDVPGLPLLSIPSASFSGEEVTEEPAPCGQDAAVDADRSPFHCDLGVSAVKLGVEEEALEIRAQLAEAQDLEVGPTLRRRGRRRGARRGATRNMVGTRAIGEVGGRGKAYGRRRLREIRHGVEAQIPITLLLRT